MAILDILEFPQLVQRQKITNSTSVNSSLHELQEVHWEIWEVTRMRSTAVLNQAYALGISTSGKSPGIF